MTTITLKQNIEKLLTSNSKLKDLFLSLQDNKIKYGIYAGSLVSLITNNRIPTDIDILVANEDFDKVNNIYKDAEENLEKPLGRFLNIVADIEVEFASNLTINILNHLYKFELTQLAYSNCIFINLEELTICLTNPVDTILLKSILQRGKDQGKFDLEDIVALIKVVNIDKQYLEKRLIEINADARVTNILKQFKII